MASSELRARLANKNPVPAISLCGQNASMETTTDKVSIRWYARFRFKGFKGCQGNTFLVSVTNFQSWFKCCCMESPPWQITSIWKKRHYQLTKKHVVDLGCVLTCRTIFRSKANSFFFQKVHIYKYNGCPKTMSSTDGVDLDGDRNHCPRLRHRHSPYSPADREVIVHMVYN